MLKSALILWEKNLLEMFKIGGHCGKFGGLDGFGENRKLKRPKFEALIAASRGRNSRSEKRRKPRGL